MRAIADDYRKIIQIVLPFAAAFLVLAATRLPSQADTNHMLVIPASDGYGFDDCLASDKACGHTIADAWCEAHGMSAATSFGRSDDITASIADKRTTPIAPGSFIVNCKD